MHRVCWRRSREVADAGVMCRVQTIVDERTADVPALWELLQRENKEVRVGSST